MSLIQTVDAAVVALAVLWALRTAWRAWGARERPAGSPKACGPGGCANCGSDDKPRR